MLGNQLFGAYSPGTSIVHKSPLWLKMGFILAVSITLVATRSWLVALLSFGVVVLLGKFAGLALTSWGESLKPMMPLLVILAFYYLFMRQYDQGANILLTMITMVAASKVLLTTTPIPRLIDGFVWMCTPLKIFGLSAEKVGLSIALMIRSIPVIMNEYTLIQQAHQARGLKTWPHKMLIPLVIATVAYAQETGDALAARGLDQV